jgi:hypothetical protein
VQEGGVTIGDRDVKWREIKGRWKNGQQGERRGSVDLPMRLLDTSTLTLHEFLGDTIPNYAILSHRWEGEGGTRRSG